MDSRFEIRQVLKGMQQSLEKLRVLVVDDCRENQFLLERVLTRQGAQVAVADDGLQGVKRALSESFDVVLMDIQMPVMDGYEAMKQLKQSDFTPPVLALTAYSQGEDRLQILNAGFTAHLAKPVDLMGLIQMIRTHVTVVSGR